MFFVHINLQEKFEIMIYQDPMDPRSPSKSFRSLMDELVKHSYGNAYELFCLKDKHSNKILKQITIIQIMVHVFFS